MDVITFDQFKSLIKKTNTPSISIYMPTFHKGAEAEQNLIRYKNQIREVEKKLADKTYKKIEIDNLLKPAKAVINDTDFWDHQEDGLAVFISNGEFLHYKLSENFVENNFIADRYYVRPLLPVLNGNERFLILSLNQKSIKLFECTKYTINEVSLKDVPVSIEELLETEEVGAPQFQTPARAGKEVAAVGRPAVYREQGGGTDGTIYKEKIRRFFNLVDTGLQKYLNIEKAPLLLAGIDYLLPIYKEANSYPYILDQTFPHNTQELSDTELRDSAWEIVKTHIGINIDDALKQYKNYAKTVRASDKIEDVVKNAFSSRILYLFVNSTGRIWGKFNPNTYKVDVHYNNYEPEDIDLIDLALEQTLLHNGIVFYIDAEKMPDGKPMAALFRY